MNKADFICGLKKLGVKPGTIVLLHSSLASLGSIEGGAEIVVDSFLEVLGSEGTLLVPAFGNLGIIPEILKRKPGAITSPCPVGTLCGIGPAVEELFKDHWVPDSPHGENTPFARLSQMGGYICLLGVDQDRNTALHGVEAQLKLAYLGDVTKNFKLPDGREITKTWHYYPGPHRDFIGLDHRFLADGAMNIERIGDAQVRLIDAKKMLDLALQYGMEDPAFVLCDNPGCADCIEQRAALYKDRMNCEAFKLSASSRLAGRYIPEMVENLKASGIEYVEFDYIQGRAWFLRTPEQLALDVAELQRSGITVSGGRVSVIPGNLEKLIAAAKSADIKRISVPSVAAVAQIESLRQAGFEVLLVNQPCQNSLEVAQVARDCQSLVAFNSANFVQAGEAPFGAYRNSRFIKIIGQLDVNDCLYDGRVTRLAQGNGEIKEMVSILRCRNFSGFMVLGGGVIYPADLKTAATDFRNILDKM